MDLCIRLWGVEGMGEGELCECDEEEESELRERGEWSGGEGVEEG